MIHCLPFRFRSWPPTGTSRSTSLPCSTRSTNEGGTSGRSTTRRHLSFRWAPRIAPGPKNGRERTAMRKLRMAAHHDRPSRIPYQINGCAQLIDSYPPLLNEFSLPKRALRTKMECVFVKTARTLVTVRARLSLWSGLWEVGRGNKQPCVFKRYVRRIRTGLRRSPQHDDDRARHRRQNDGASGHLGRHGDMVVEGPGQWRHCRRRSPSRGSAVSSSR